MCAEIHAEICAEIPAERYAPVPRSLWHAPQNPHAAAHSLSVKLSSVSLSYAPQDPHAAAHSLSMNFGFFSHSPFAAHDTQFDACAPRHGMVIIW